MNDISKCEGKKEVKLKAQTSRQYLICPLRESCKRFLLRNKGAYESVIEAPFSGSNCELYYPKIGHHTT
jgi:hypothetical protein